MKKIFLAALLGLFSLAANANQKVRILNGLPPCPGMQVTIQFFAYAEGVCTFDISSPVYPVVSGQIFDMCDPMVWAPSVLWMPSYETFTAVVCVWCPGMAAPFCLPECGIDCNPPHACFPLAVPSTPFPGCCFGSIGDNCIVPGSGGGACMDFKIHL